MTGMTIRDPAEMKKFAKQIDDYAEKMKLACKNLSSAIATAKPMMKDAQSQRAFDKIENLAMDLVKGLKDAEEVAEKLRAAAKPLEDAQNIKYS